MGVRLISQPHEEGPSPKTEGSGMIAVPYIAFEDFLKYVLELYKEELLGRDQLEGGRPRLPVGSCLEKGQGMYEGWRALRDVRNYLKNKISVLIKEIKEKMQREERLPLTFIVNIDARNGWLVPESPSLRPFLETFFNLLTSCSEELERILLEDRYSVGALYALDLIEELGLVIDYRVGMDEIMPGHYILNAYVRRDWLELDPGFDVKLALEMMDEADSFAQSELNRFRHDIQRRLKKCMEAGEIDELAEFLCNRTPTFSSKHKGRAKEYWTSFINSIRGLFTEVPEAIGNVDYILDSLVYKRRLLNVWCFRRIVDLGFPAIPEVRFEWKGLEADVIVFLTKRRVCVVEVTTRKKIEAQKIKNVKEIADMLRPMAIAYPLLICRSDAQVEEPINVLRFDEMKSPSRVISALFHEQESSI
jgi:hypothetical protein